MDKEKISNLLEVTKGEVVDVVLESDFIKEEVSQLFLQLGESAATGIAKTFLISFIPKIGSFISNYKQNKTNQKLFDLLTILNKRVDEVEQRFALLNQEQKEMCIVEYPNWIAQYMELEKQDNKVKYYLDGYINLINENINDDLLIMFFDTISQLNNLDIECLEMYNYKSDTNIYRLMDKYHVDNYQIAFIKEKLARFGLIESNNDLVRDKNIDNVVEYLSKIEKESKKSRPGNVKMSNMKKPNRADSYTITSLGRHYLNLITNDE